MIVVSTLGCGPGRSGSSPLVRTKLAPVAQRLERLKRDTVVYPYSLKFCNDNAEVSGSNPDGGTNFKILLAIMFILVYIILNARKRRRKRHGTR